MRERSWDKYPKEKEKPTKEVSEESKVIRLIGNSETEEEFDVNTLITVYARNASEVKAFIEMNYPGRDIVSIQYIPGSVTQKHLEYVVRLKK